MFVFSSNQELAEWAQFLSYSWKYFKISDYLIFFIPLKACQDLGSCQSSFIILSAEVGKLISVLVSFNNFHDYSIRPKMILLKRITVIYFLSFKYQKTRKKMV